MREPTKVPVQNLCDDDFALLIEAALRLILRFTPEEYLSGLNGISLREGPENRAERRSDTSDSLGYYMREQQRIVLNLWWFREKWPHADELNQEICGRVGMVFLHELGHHCDLWLRQTHLRQKNLVENAADDWMEVLMKKVTDEMDAAKKTPELPE